VFSVRLAILFVKSDIEKNVSCSRLLKLTTCEKNILTTKVITLVNNWGLGKRSSCVYRNTSSSGWQ
jgi:hypothetical protein